VDERTLLELIAAETDPLLRKVLEQYRGAEIELNAASEQLEKMGRQRWSAAAASRARDVAWQAQRYMRLERAAKPPTVLDFMDDADTNPRGYPKHTGLSASVAEEPSEVFNTDEAVLDTDPAPPLLRRARIQQWCVQAVLFVLIAAALWLMRHYLLTVD
jgi:hypothetical protein